MIGEAKNDVPGDGAPPATGLGSLAEHVVAVEAICIRLRSALQFLEEELDAQVVLRECTPEAEYQRIVELEKENSELRTANTILRQASMLFARAGLRGQK